MTEPAIRIVVVEYHAIVREGLRLLLSDRSGFSIVGDASTREGALAAALEHRPDVLLLDLELGRTRGEDLIDAIRDVSPASAILVLTGICDRQRHRVAMLRGARGVVTKDSAAALLVKAIRKVHAGEIWLERSQMGTLLTEMLAKKRHQDEDTRRIATLTERERAVITLVGQGLRNEEIGVRLVLREKTVRNYLTSVYEKLGVKDRLELAIYAHRRHLASLHDAVSTAG